MTSPIPGPGRFRAFLTGLTADGLDTSIQPKGTFASVGEARQWVLSQISHPARQHEVRRIGVTQFRARILDTRPIPDVSPVVYDITGEPYAVRNALSDTAVSVIVPEIVAGDRSLDPVRVLPGMVRLYGHVAAEALRAPEDVVVGAKRAALRGDLAMLVSGLDDDACRSVLTRIELIDLLPLVRPDGAFLAQLDRSEGAVGQRFAVRRHAREWLRLMCEAGESGAVMTASLTEWRDGRQISSVAVRDSGAALARQFDTGDADGTLVTGIAGVDRERLSELITRYQVAASAPPIYESVAESIGMPVMRVQRSTEHSVLGWEIAHMLTDPGLRVVTADLRKTLAAADRGLRLHPNTVCETPGLSTSGFIGAELQIALDQHHDLHLDLARGDARRVPGDLEGRIRDVGNRIGELLRHPSLSATDRLAVLDDVALAASSPTNGYNRVFALPSYQAIVTRAETLREPSNPRDGAQGRDVDELLRLHQVASVTMSEADPYAVRELRVVQDDLRRAIETRLTNNPQLLQGQSAVARSLLVGLGHDPYHEIPSRRAVYLPSNMAPQQMNPPTVDTVHNYQMAAPDPTRPDRQVVLGTENGHWVARDYRDYPGFPDWKRPAGAASFASATDMVEALRAGVVYRDESGIQRRMAPIELPPAITHRLTHMSRLKERPMPAVQPRSAPTTGQPPVRRPVTPSRPNPPQGRRRLG